MKKVLVLHSGGQDSTTCLFWAIKRFEKVYMINLHSDILDEHQINFNQELNRKIGFLNINIKDEMFSKKDDLLLQLDNITEKYSNHIKTYIAPDGDNLGYEKIIKTLKERFFN